MNTNRFRLTFLALGITIAASCFIPASAETVFVRGYNDGWRTYAVIRRNGVEYRTDRMGPTFNRNLWLELSPDDSLKLIRAYSWQLNRRRDHFGTDTSGDMAQFYNDQAGWTALVDALKDRRMNNDYPRLQAAFGPDAALNLPAVYSPFPEVMDTATYRQAAILAGEIQEDFEIGRRLYQTLADAKWDQISVAVKGISGPLIKIIVDNFMTPFMTHGAKAGSELAATLFNFTKDLHGFLDEANRPGNAPPTPRQLIDRIEAILVELERIANMAADAVESKTATLAGLSETIDAMNQTIKNERAAEGHDLVDALESRIGSIPDPAPLLITADDTQEPYEYWQEMNAKATAYWHQVINEADNLQAHIQQQKDPILNAYAVGTTTVPMPAPIAGYFAGMQSRFKDIYFDVDQYLVADPEPGQGSAHAWSTGKFYQPALTRITTQSRKLEVCIEDAGELIGDALTSINDLHARVLGLDAYTPWMGNWDHEEEKPIPASTPPSESFQERQRQLRDLSDLVNVIAHTNTPTQARVTDLQYQERLIAPGPAAFHGGRAERVAWMRAAWQTYESLRFNFESSLSYVMGVLNQFDALHGDPAYYIWMTPEYWNGYPVHRYRIDIPALNARIEQHATADERLAERLAVTQELYAFRDLETDLARRLVIAQNAHLADATEMQNLIAGIGARYEHAWWDWVVADFQQTIGKTLISQHDLWKNLVGDNPTYYYVGSPGLEKWIRTPEKCRTQFMLGDIQRISGRVDEYYRILELYHDMEYNLDDYLAMSVEEFDDFMTTTTQMIGSYPKGFWIQQLEAKGVSAPEYPAWRLVFKTRQRQNALNDLYRYGPNTSDETSSGRTTASLALRPDIHGRLLSDLGTPLEGIEVQLAGQMAAWTVTDSAGRYVFDFLPPGTFTVTPRGDGSFQPPSHTVAFDGHEIVADFSRPSTADNGYTLAGAIRDGTGNPITGERIQIRTAGGDFIADIFSDVNGEYAMAGLPAATYRLHVVSVTNRFEPDTRTVVLPPSSDGCDFVRQPGTATRIVRLSGDLDFGDVEIGASASRMLRIHNDGNTTLQVEDIWGSPGFQAAWKGAVAADGFRDVSVTFQPMAIQAYSGSITVLSNAEGEPVTRACSGTGLEPAPRIMAGNRLDFGPVTTNMQAVRNLRIHNLGDRFMVVDALQFPPGFSGSWSGVVAAASSIDTPVTFRPLVAVPYSGNVTVTVNAGTAEFRIPCSGSGQEARIPVEWLASYGLPTDGSADFIDWDGDGFTAWQEWRAGTDPLCYASALRVWPPAVAAPGSPVITVRWSAAAGRSYRIERAGSLRPDTTFTTIADSLPGIDGIMEFNDTPPAPLTGPWFYRVVVE